jgi:hypothetical protein
MEGKEEGPLQSRGGLQKLIFEDPRYIAREKIASISWRSASVIAD